MNYADYKDPVITWPLDPAQRITVTFYDGPDDPAMAAGRRVQKLADEMMALPADQRDAWLQRYRESLGVKPEEVTPEAVTA